MCGNAAETDRPTLSCVVFCCVGKFIIIMIIMWVSLRIPVASLHLWVERIVFMFECNVRLCCYVLRVGQQTHHDRSYYYEKLIFYFDSMQLSENKIDCIATFCNIIPTRTRNQHTDWLIVVSIQYSRTDERHDRHHCEHDWLNYLNMHQRK